MTPPDNDAHIHAEAEGYLKEMTRWLVWRAIKWPLLLATVVGGEMREIGLCFADNMVRALLDGRKTQTRRLVKPPKWATCEQVWRAFEEGRPALVLYREGRVAKKWTFPYAVGDRIWVREAWAENIPGCERGLSYRADHRDSQGDGHARPMRWRPSIHMPCSFCRLVLDVASVRMERLQEIREEDAKAEGVGSRVAGQDEDGPIRTYRTGFVYVWDSIYAERRDQWEANLFVWVLEFKAIERGDSP